MTKAKLKIKKGDKVVVLTGGSKGSTGEVLRVMPEEQKVIVRGVNLRTKHRKPTQTNPQGGIDKIEAAIHVSNVALADPKTGKPTRIGYKTVGEKKVRVARRSKETID